MLAKSTYVAALIAFAGPACAQQQSDPALGACQQLLGQANAQTIQVAAQAQTLAKQLEETKAEIERLKNPEKK